MKNPLRQVAFSFRGLMRPGIIQKYSRFISLLIILTGCCTLFSFGQSNGDYRTRASGNWNGTNVWQKYSGGWSNVSTSPTSADKAITILNTHTVTVTTSVSIDQLTINAGGEVIVNGAQTLTIVNGSGTDATIAGKLTNSGTLSIAGTTTNSGTVTNNGAMSFSGATTNSGTITNNGTFSNTSTLGNSGTYTNTGTHTSSGTITNTGTVNNSGTINTGSTFNNNNTLTSSGTITNTATFTNNSSATISGILTNTGNVNGSSNIGFAAGAEYSHAKNGGALPTGTWNATSTCKITGSTSSVPSGLGQSFGNFTWNCAAQSNDLNLSGALTSVSGNFTVSSTSTKILYLTNTTATTMNIGGGLNISGGNLIFASGNNPTVTVNVTGAFSQSSGSLIFSSASQVGTMTLNVTGNFSQTGGSLDFASGNANNTRTPALNIGGNFSQTGSATIETSSTDLDIINGTITFNKNGTQTFSIANQGNLTNTNFIIGSTSTLELNSDLTLSSNSDDERAGRFTVNSGATFNAKTSSILTTYNFVWALPPWASLNTDFILNSGATLITANTSGVQSGTTGSVTADIANRTFSSGANYIFNGTSAQNSGTFTTSPTANQVNNLTVDNTGGGNGVTLQQSLAVAGTCFFTAGRITSSATYLLIFNDNAIASGANNNSSNPSYVNGPVRKIGNDAFTFPVGKSNVGYMPCGISAPSNTTHAFTAEYKRNSATLLGLISILGLNHVSQCEYWDINRTTGTSTVNVTLYWSGLSPCNAAGYVTDLTKLVIAHHNGLTWNAYSNNGGTTGNGASGSVTWNNVSSFSPFSLGSTDPIANPLRIQLSDIKAYKVTTGNKVEWTNLTEENIDRYDVERSANGTSFTSITAVTPGSNNNDAQQYDIIDAQPLNGTNFYRVKAIEYSGTFAYSTIVKVAATSGNEGSVSVYPNPVSSGQFTLQLSNYNRGTYQLQLINTAGQNIMTKTLQHNGGSASISVNVPGSVNTGFYMLQINGEGKSEIIKLAVK